MTISPEKRFRDEWEAAVAEAYADELGLAEVTPRTAFSEVGDDGAAARIVERVSRATRTPLTPQDLVIGDSVERVAAHLRTRAPADRCMQLPADFDPCSPTLFYFHSASGSAMAIRTLRGILPAQPVGVRAAGLAGERDVPTTVEEFAAVYLDELLRLPECEPYLLCGFSTGGAIAFEVACRLLARGRRVGLLALFDTQPPDPSRGVNMISEPALISGRLRELLRRIGIDAPDTIEAEDDGVVTSLREARVLAETVGAETLRRQLIVYARAARADLRYRPGHFDGDLHFFNAEVADELVGNWAGHARRLHRHDVDAAEHHEYSIFANQGFRTVFATVVGDAVTGRPHDT